MDRASRKIRGAGSTRGSDDGILQPDTAAPPDVTAAVAPVTPANGSLVLRFVSTYVGGRLPKGDANRVELVRGILVRSPRPAPLHGRILMRLARRLDEFVESRGLGVVLPEVGAVLARDPDTVRGPDIAFYSPEWIPKTGYGTGYWGPPDLAVEIVSPEAPVSAAGSSC